LTGGMTGACVVVDFVEVAIVEDGAAVGVTAGGEETVGALPFL